MHLRRNQPAPPHSSPHPLALPEFGLLGNRRSLFSPLPLLFCHVFIGWSANRLLPSLWWICLLRFPPPPFHPSAHCDAHKHSLACATLTAGYKQAGTELDVWFFFLILEKISWNQIMIKNQGKSEVRQWGSKTNRADAGFEWEGWENDKIRLFS